MVEILTPLSGSADAASASVALWSLLHGMWVLESAHLLGGKKPKDVSWFAIDAFSGGISHR